MTNGDQAATVDLGRCCLSHLSVYGPRWLRHDRPSAIGGGPPNRLPEWLLRIGEDHATLPFEMAEVNGFFWRPDKPDEKISGALVVDDEGLRLRLECSFESFQATMDGESRYDLVHGITHDGDVTLLDCVQSGSQMRLPGYVRQQLWIQSAVLDGHIQANEVFDELIIQCDHLADWHRRTGLRFEPQPDDSIEKWKAAYVWPDELRAILPDGSELELAFGHHISPDLGRFEVVERSSLLVRSSSPAPPNELFSRYAAPLRDFLTIATLAPAVLMKVFVRSDQHGSRLPNGKLHKIDLELRGRFVQPALRERVASTIHPVYQLFSIEDHPGGFERLLPNWFDLYSRAKEAIDLYVGLVYQPPFWFPNKVATLAQALEAYHRLVLPQPDPDSDEVRRRDDVLATCPNEHREWLESLVEYAHEPRLRKRLSELVERIAPLVMPVFNSSKQRKRFAKDLADARNLQAHPGDRSRPVGVDMERLYTVFQEARWVFLTNVLVDLQFPDDRIAAVVQRNQEFLRLQAR